MNHLARLTFLTLFSFFTTILVAQEEYGLASFYGDEFEGGETASGEAYDRNKLTAAHKTLDLGTKVRVTRLDTKKSVVVRINDRGPYLKGRIIDLSGRAAEALDMMSEGTAEVRLEVLGGGGASGRTAATVSKPVNKPVTVPEVTIPASRPTVTVRPPAQTGTTSTTTVTTTTRAAKPKSASSETATVAKRPAAAKKTIATQASNRAADVDDVFELVTPKTYSEYGLYKVELSRPKKAGYGVQIGVFSDYENTMKKVAELQGKWFRNILMSVEKGSDGKKQYKLILGPFDDQASANAYKRAAKKNKKINGFVVDLSAM